MHNEFKLIFKKIFKQIQSVGLINKYTKVKTKKWMEFINYRTINISKTMRKMSKSKIIP